MLVAQIIPVIKECAFPGETVNASITMIAKKRSSVSTKDVLTFVMFMKIAGPFLVSALIIVARSLLHATLETLVQTDLSVGKVFAQK